MQYQGHFSQRFKKPCVSTGNKPNFKFDKAESNQGKNAWLQDYCYEYSREISRMK